MHKILTALLLALILTFTAQAKIFTISDGDISFDAPNGFETMSDELVQIKYPKVI